MYLRRAHRFASGASLVVVCIALFAGPALGQNSEDPASEPATETAAEAGNTYGSGVGFQILLSNSGFGLGAYYYRAITSSTSFMSEISIGAGKDERESKFFRFGSSYIPYKANYMLMMPVHAGVIHRLFSNVIADNFRPYVQATAGPTLGWEYPYFEDLNGNEQYDSRDERTFDSIGAIPKGEFRFGLGGMVALGAHFGLSKRVTQGVRIGYSFTHFFQGIQLLEPQVQEAQRNFGTPTITLTFGKLL